MHVLVAARHASAAQARDVVADAPLRRAPDEPELPHREAPAARAARASPSSPTRSRPRPRPTASREAHRAIVVTVLRTAPILGPTVHNYVTRYLARRVVPTMMGFDPLGQFLHEVDAIAAFKLAIDRDFPGIFNIVGDGVLPLSTVIKLAGRGSRCRSRTRSRTRWRARSGSRRSPRRRRASSTYLRFLCVADGEKADGEDGLPSRVHHARGAPRLHERAAAARRAAPPGDARMSAPRRRR